jgi:hypothetical protein
MVQNTIGAVMRSANYSASYNPNDGGAMYNMEDAIGDHIGNSMWIGNLANTGYTTTGLEDIKIDREVNLVVASGATEPLMKQNFLSNGTAIPNHFWFKIQLNTNKNGNTGNRITLTIPVSGGIFSAGPYNVYKTTVFGTNQTVTGGTVYLPLAAGDLVDGRVYEVVYLQEQRIYLIINGIEGQHSRTLTVQGSLDFTNATGVPVPAYSQKGMAYINTATGNIRATSNGDKYNCGYPPDGGTSYPINGGTALVANDILVIDDRNGANNWYYVLLKPRAGDIITNYNYQNGPTGTHIYWYNGYNYIQIS